MNTMVTAVIAITMGRSNVVITEESHNTLRHRVTTATTIVPTKDWLAVSSVAFWATNWGGQSNRFRSWCRCRVIFW